MSTIHDPASTSSTGRRPTGPVPLEREPLSPDELLGLELESGTRDVARRMLEHGASAEFTRLVLKQVVAEGARGAWAVDAAAGFLARSVPILPSPKRPRGHVSPPLFAFVGPTGVGKTTALVKLGRKLVAAGRRVVYASLDPLSMDSLERAGGLEGDVDRGEVPIALVRDGKDLQTLLKRSGTVDAVLLDTPGLSPRDEQQLDELAREVELCGRAGELQTLLVLSATASRGALRMTTAAFAPFRADGAVLTKLDETDEPAAAVEALVRSRLPLAFLCDGQDTRAHLYRPSGDSLSDLVLRGHLRGGTPR